MRICSSSGVGGNGEGAVAGVRRRHVKRDARTRARWGLFDPHTTPRAHQQCLTNARTHRGPNLSRAIPPTPYNTYIHTYRPPNQNKKVQAPL